MLPSASTMNEVGTLLKFQSSDESLPLCQRTRARGLIHRPAAKESAFHAQSPPALAEGIPRTAVRAAALSGAKKAGGSLTTRVEHSAKPPVVVRQRHARRNSIRRRGRQTEGRRRAGASQSSTSEGQNRSLSGRPGSVISGRADLTDARPGKFPRARALRKNAAISIPKSRIARSKDSG